MLKRLRSDKANSTFVTFVLGFLFLTLAVAMSIDLAKSAYIKNAYSSTAQQSAQAAIKNMDGKGSIKEEALNDFISNYNGEANTGNISGSFGKTSENTFRAEACNVREIDGYGEVELPFVVMKLDTERGLGANSEVTYTSEGGADPRVVSGHYNRGATYRVLDVEVYDSARNMMLGIFGLPCQNTHSHVSAIHFGSQQDIEELAKKQEPKTEVPVAPNETWTPYCLYSPHMAEKWKNRSINAPTGMGVELVDSPSEGRARIDSTRTKLTYTTPDSSEFMTDSVSFTYRFYSLRTPDVQGEIGTITIPNGCL